MKKHILIAETDRRRLRQFTEALNQANIPYKCTWALSGEQALSQLRYLTPDILFINTELPGMDGLEVLAAARRMSHLNYTKCVLYAEHTDTGLQLQAAALGAAACIECNSSTDLSLTLKQLLHPALALATT